MLDVGYVDVRPRRGQAVVLLHGWPYDIHSYAKVAPALGAAGYRVVVPYLRGCGSTRFEYPRPVAIRATYGAGMSDPSEATITGIHHFSPTVSDVEASAAWYEQVFTMFRVPVTFPHHEREDTGYAVMLIDPVSGLGIGLHHNTANRGEAFDEARTGLDHIGLKVPTRESLDAWAAKLDGLGIEHSGIRDLTDPVPFSTLVFRDPDNIQLEFIYSP